MLLEVFFTLSENGLTMVGERSAWREPQLPFSILGIGITLDLLMVACMEKQ